MIFVKDKLNRENKFQVWPEQQRAADHLKECVELHTTCLIFPIRLIFLKDQRSVESWNHRRSIGPCTKSKEPTALVKYVKKKLTKASLVKYA